MAPAVTRQSAASVRAERLLAVLYSLAIAGYPLVAAALAVTGLPSRLVTVPYRVLVLGLSLVALLAVGLLRDRLYRGWFWVPFGLFWLMYLPRVLHDTLWDPPVMVTPPTELLMQAVAFTLVPTLAVMVRMDAAGLRVVGRIVCYVTLAAGLLAPLASVAAVRETGLQAFGGGRLGTEAFNPISLGHVGVSATLLGMLLLFDRDRPRAWPVVLLAMLTGLAAAAVSGSRGPLLALAVAGLAVVGAAAARGRGGRALLVLGAAGAATYWAIVVAGEAFGVATLARIEAFLAGGLDPSSQEHADAMRYAWQQFLDHPVLGSAVVELVFGQYPHNVLIEAFMALGVVGGATFVVLLAWSGIAALKLVRRPESAWLAVLYIQYMIAALLAGSLYGSYHMWIFMVGVVVAAAAAPAPKPSRSEPLA